MSEPERQCIGCGRRGPQSELLRLAVERKDGSTKVVVAGGRHRSGRGAYLCHRISCLERAIHRKAFQRAFRASVVLEESEIVAALTTRAGQGDGGR